MSWSVDPEHLEEAQGAFDAVLTNWGRDCLLYHTPRKVRCDNCQRLLIGGVLTATHRSGGPIPFAHGQSCPVCEGAVLREEQSTETVVLFCVFEPAKFTRPAAAVPVVTAAGLAETHGLMSDWPKVRRAESALLPSSMAGNARARYRRVSEAWDTNDICPGRYFACLWERRGD